MGRRNLIWVRDQRNANTVVGVAPVDTANVLSVRSESLYTVGGLGLTQFALTAGFTLKRLLIWWQINSNTAIDITATPYGIIGARVGFQEEFEEFGVNPGYLAENGPVSKADADWLAWVPCMPSMVTQGAANDQHCGRGFVDIRAQRRCSDVSEDIFVFSQVQNIAATDTTTLAMTWAALCDAT